MTIKNFYRYSTHYNYFLIFFSSTFRITSCKLPNFKNNQYLDIFKISYII